MRLEALTFHIVASSEILMFKISELSEGTYFFRDSIHICFGEQPNKILKKRKERNEKKKTVL